MPPRGWPTSTRQRRRPPTGSLPAAGALRKRGNTHYSVVDGQGNAVSNTYTLNFSYGVGMMAGDTGILL
ncbi:gamma-glutamyltransferase, partial [Klebsiella pneumoniae subsp. pneumoniae]